MIDDPVILLLVGCILALAGMLQSVVGFGSALFATPLLIWLGIPLPDSITIIATCSTIQAMLGMTKLRHHIPWKQSLYSVIVRIITTLVGLFFLKALVILEPSDIKGIIGGILCLLVVFQFVWQPHPVDSMHWSWSLLAWGSSGFLSGFCGMGGPPLIFWAMQHNWNTRKIRGFMFAVMTLSTPFQLFLLCITFGSDIIKSFCLGLLFFPIVYIASHIGLSLGDRMPKAILRRVMLIILLVIGIGAILQSIKR